jgi:hypothetical protein
MNVISYGGGVQSTAMVVLAARGRKLGKDDVYLTRFAQPLREAIASADEMLPLFSPDTDSCDDGYCWT